MTNWCWRFITLKAGGGEEVGWGVGWGGRSPEAEQVWNKRLELLVLRTMNIMVIILSYQSYHSLFIHFFFLFFFFFTI